MKLIICISRSLKIMRNSKKILSILALVIVMQLCYSQNDSIAKKDSISLKQTLFKNYKLSTGIDFNDHNVTYNYIRLYDANFYRYSTKHDPFFLSWPFRMIPSDNYTQYAFRNIQYSKYDLLKPYGYYTSYPWVDPANPTGSDNISDALILGTLNYLFFMIFDDEQ